MKAIERLYQYLEKKGIKPGTFEKQIGLSNGYLGKQYNRHADIGESIILQIIENCPDLSPVWLLTGKETMLLAEKDKLSGVKKQPVECKNIEDKLLEVISKKDEQISEMLLQIGRLEKEVEYLKMDVAYRFSLAHELSSDDTKDK